MYLKNKSSSLSLFIIAMLLSGCAVGPDYIRPSTTVPNKFKEAKGKAFLIENQKDWKIAQPRDDMKRGEWWKIFNDPQLDALESQLNLYNQNIANALANYCQARDIVNQARARLFPAISGVFSAFRQRGGGATSFINTSGTTGSTSTGTATTGLVPAKSVARTSFSGFLNANWEPDIWGLVRRTIEGDIAAAQSSQALLAVTTLSAQGALAQYYFELRALDMDQQLLDKTVFDYRKALELTRNQYTSGVASRSDIVQAQSQLQVAQADAINNGILRSQYEHAIAVLMGRPPADFSMPFKPLKGIPPVIPVTVPTAWLERRPDIAQAERLMQQTSAQIGVALTAYYPSLNLSGSVSGGGTSVAQMLTNPSTGWSYGLQVADIIFDGGLRDATVKAAKAGYTAQVAAYRQTVLTAFQDVEDNLAALRLLEKEGVVRNKAAASAVEALHLVMNQYKSGTVPYSSVITAQIAAYTAQRTAYDMVGLQMSTAVGLIKALGGGWRAQDIEQM
jgi:NodT family efflux transporter outer membrane factor (OMF) lipoprotein